LGSPLLRQALEKDRDLRQRVKDAARDIEPSDYAWVHSGSGPQALLLRRWSQRLAPEERLDADTAELLLWAAARPGVGRDGFTVLLDSTGERSCGRGLLALTYRQGLHLGLAVQPDAYFRGSAGSLDTNSAMAELVKGVLPASAPLLPEDGAYSSEILSRGQQCVYLTGEDDRGEDRRLIQRLSLRLGRDARGLPGASSPEGGVARLAMLYAADIPLNDYTDRDSPALDFSQGEVSQVLRQAGPDGEWVMEQVAAAVARALVLRCAVSLHGSEAWSDALLLGDPPDEIACIILDYRLQNGW
jgi:hypothetical protein